MADDVKYPLERDRAGRFISKSNVCCHADVAALESLCEALATVQVAYERKQEARRRESDDKYREAVDAHRAAIEAAKQHPLYAAVVAKIKEKKQ